MSVAAPDLSQPTLESKIRSNQKLTLVEATECFKRMYGEFFTSKIETFVNAIVDMGEEHPHLFCVWKGMFIAIINPVYAKDYVFRGSYNDVKILQAKTAEAKPQWNDQKYRVTFNPADESIIISEVKEKAVTVHVTGGAVTETPPAGASDHRVRRVYP